MYKTLLVARREYLFNLRRPAFLFAVFGVPLFICVIWFIIFAVMSASEANVDKIGAVGYVDEAGILANPLLPPDYSDLFVAFDSSEMARQALEARTIGAYMVLPPDYLKTGQVITYSYTGIPEALKDAIGELLTGTLSRRVAAQAPLERILDPVNLTVRVMDSGRVLTEANIPALFMLPMIFALLFVIAAGVTSGFLMSGVVEEKTNRIMEILVTSVTPIQLLGGKILGLGALGLTQIAVWMVAALVLLQVGQAAPFLAGITFPTDVAILLLVYFGLSYFLLASLQGGIGAVVGSEQESRQFASIISILWMTPFFFLPAFLEDPNGVIAVALTLIPFSSPLTALLRMGMSSVPNWQILLSLAILFVTTVAVTWASARVFRWGLLRYGKRFDLRDLLQAVRQPAGRAEGVTPVAAKEGVR